MESKKFDGKKEIGLSLKQLSRDDVLSQLCDLEFLMIIGRRRVYFSNYHIGEPYYWEII